MENSKRASLAVLQLREEKTNCEKSLEAEQRQVETVGTGESFIGGGGGRERSLCFLSVFSSRQ